MTHFESVIQDIALKVESYLRGEIELKYVQSAIDYAADALDVSDAPTEFINMMHHVPDRLEEAWYASPLARKQVDAILVQFLDVLRQELEEVRLKNSDATELKK